MNKSNSDARPKPYHFRMRTNSIRPLDHQKGPVLLGKLPAPEQGRAQVGTGGLVIFFWNNGMMT